MKRDIPVPHVGMRFLHATIERADCRIPAPCTVSAVSGGILAFRVGGEADDREPVALDLWPVICYHAIPAMPAPTWTEEEASAIDAAMNADKLRHGYDDRRVAATERAELNDTARYARSLYPNY